MEGKLLSQGKGRERHDIEGKNVRGMHRQNGGVEGKGGRRRGKSSSKFLNGPVRTKGKPPRQIRDHPDDCTAGIRTRNERGCTFLAERRQDRVELLDACSCRRRQGRPKRINKNYEGCAELLHKGGQK